MFSHSGDCGDVVYALPVIKACGGGRLSLFPADCTGHRMTPARAEFLAPLLVSQWYVEGVEWAPGPSGLNLDNWRHHYKNGYNLADLVADWLHMDHSPREESWLIVDPKPVAEVVIARSPRYHNKKFPWGEIYNRYGGRAVFVGLKEEHSAFESITGHVEFRQMKDALEMAQIMAGAKLVVCNQSFPRSVAEGLKAPVLVEVGNPPNTHFDRRTAWYCEGDKLPEMPCF